MGRNWHVATIWNRFLLTEQLSYFFWRVQIFELVKDEECIFLRRRLLLLLIFWLSLGQISCGLLLGLLDVTILLAGRDYNICSLVLIVIFPTDVHIIAAFQLWSWRGVNGATFELADADLAPVFYWVFYRRTKILRFRERGLSGIHTYKLVGYHLAFYRTLLGEQKAIALSQVCIWVKYLAHPITCVFPSIWTFNLTFVWVARNVCTSSSDC